MFRKLLRRVTVLAVVLAFGCSGDGITTDLVFPWTDLANSTTSAVSAQVLNLASGVPEGRRITFLGDEIVVSGKNYVPNLKVFFGVNHEIQHRPNSLFTTPRHLLPSHPFIYTDPVTGDQIPTEGPVDVQYNSPTDIVISVPPAVACTDLLTNPTLRFFGNDGSSFPAEDIFHVVGPICIAMTPNKIPDVGGDSVIVHGDFFSFYTQVAFRYVDPASGETIVVGADAESDIQEIYIDRHTLVIPEFPGVVPNSNLGLARELKVDVLIFENIEEITSNPALEPALNGKGACSALRSQSNEIPLEENGVRNSEKKDGFTFLPTGVTDYPSVAGIVPEEGSEVGLNTVVIHGDQFDGFTVDLSDPERPGIGIECPPDSGHFIAPKSAILVDRQTVVIKMPPCEIEIPEKVAFCLTNKYSLDNPVPPQPAEEPYSGPGDGATADGTCIVFDDIYTYIPVPPIAPPVVTAIHPITRTGLDKNEGNDFGLQKFLVVGDWFDGHTTLNGSFEFVLPNGEVIQSLRTILHNRNLIEVYTKRLPDSVYPLSEDLTVTVRVRNVIGHSDFVDAFTFKPLPDAGETPELTLICGTAGPDEGGNEILVYGNNFDTTTEVLFEGTPAPSVQYVNSGLLIATVPNSDVVAGQVGEATVEGVTVTVQDDGEAGIGSAQYLYGEPTAGSILGSLDPDFGSSTGGYNILAYGVEFTPLARVEFGAGDGNFSPNVRFLSRNLLLVEVPEAFDDQIGATVDVGLTDPLNGLEETIKTVPFTYVSAREAAPEILYVDTTVEVPITPTELPALNITGGDRMLIIGRNFDQRTTFDITKPQESTNSANCTDVEILTPNIAVCRSPASPDELPGIADLQAHNDFGDSNTFPVEYVEPGPPAILDVRNLDTGTTDAPIDANDRLLIFGDNFFLPLTVKLTGCDINDQEETITVELTESNITVVEDHLIGVNIPADTFCEGPLDIVVETNYGTVSFDDAEGDPIFQLIGPQPPQVLGVFESKFNSGGGEEAIFFGRNFTSSTQFSVRTENMEEGVFTPVFNLSTRIISNTVATVVMPALPGGMPPLGVSGSVRAEEMDAELAKKIAGDKFTVSDDLFRVCNDQEAMLLGIFPDHGSIAGGEQVLLTGTGFLKATGESNIESITFAHSDIELVDSYTEADPTELPLDSLNPANRGKFVILNDHQILLISKSRPAIAAPDTAAPATVTITSFEDEGEGEGVSILAGGYTYLNTPAEITPFLLGITPNETRLDGGTSHLVSGGFLTSADRLVFTRESDDASLTIPSTQFDEVNDNFIVFVMPDLSGTFSAGDVLALHAEKDLGGGTVESNVIHTAIRVTFAGPPTITPSLSPDSGSGFGGTVVKIEGTLFTSNTQVLFGTMPARQIVVAGPTEIYAVVPTLPVSAPEGGLSLDSLHSTDKATVDVAVFTQGGWAVLEEGFTFTEEEPTFDSCNPTEFTAGQSKTIHVSGSGFVPGATSVTPTTGVVSNLVVHGFDSLSFDYLAPLGAPKEIGPKTASFLITTNMGSVEGCDLTIKLPPFITDCESSWATNSAASPTTGVADGALVKVTVTGGNFETGGAMWLIRGGTASAIPMTEATGGITGGGQWELVNGTTIVFSVPNIFSSDVPTLLEGNRNIGPVAIRYANADGVDADLSDCFSYVPAIQDFEDYSFTVTNPVAPMTARPDKVTLGDVNADGVLDVAMLVRGDDSTWLPLKGPEAYILLADTFGPGVDINGDGVSPDWAGSFTQQTISDDTVQIEHFRYGRGGRVLLENLDDDDALEVIIPASVHEGPNCARVLFADMQDDGTFKVVKIFKPVAGTTGGVAGIASGNFGGTDGVDIALILGSPSDHERDIVILTSTDTPFEFDEEKSESVPIWNDDQPSFLAAGDFDGDGDDDLIWGHHRLNTNATQNLLIMVGEVEDGKVIDQSPLTNVHGGDCAAIAIFDCEDDGEGEGEPKAMEAAVLLENGIKGDLTGGEPTESAILIIKNPLTYEADDYYLTGFIDSGRGLGAGDLNADGHVDLAAVSEQGKMLIYLGGEDCVFKAVNRTWTSPTGSGSWHSRVEGIAIGDINRDGLGDVFVGDAGYSPQALVFWLNTAR